MNKMIVLKVTKRGIELPCKYINQEQLNYLKKSLTVKHNQFITKDRPQLAISIATYIHDIKNDMIYLPRITGANILRKFDQKFGFINAFPELDKIKIGESKLQLHDFQKEIIETLMREKYNDNRINNGVASCILDLPPGNGKSFIAMGLFEKFAQKTLYIVPGKDLLQQTINLFKQIYPELSIGWYHSDDHQDGDLVVMTIASATQADEYIFGKTKYKAFDYLSKFGFTIFDEIHTYCTKERQSVFRRCASAVMFGTSGTCFHRLDKMDPVAHYHVGSPVIGKEFLPERKNAESWTLDARVINYNGPDTYTKPLVSTQGMISQPLMVNQFSQDPYRSQILVEEIKKLVRADHRIIVLLDRTELVKLAHDYLKTAIDEEPLLKRVSMITGNVDAESRSAARDSRVVLGTYACLGTGISWPEFTAIIFWHPRKTKFEQFLNRVFRDGGDRSKTRVAIYLRDNATALKSQYLGFRKVCKEEHGVNPETIEINWNEIDLHEEIKKIADGFSEWLAKKSI